MKNTANLTAFGLICGSLLSASLFSSALYAADDAGFESESDKLSYSLGVMMGERVLKRYGDINYDLVMEAMQAQHKGTDTRISIDDAGAALQAFEQEAAKEDAMMAKESGDKFLAENAAREGVSVTDSGLQWEVVMPSEGAKPGLEDTVSVHYVGTLINGTEFDSSVSRGQPASFPLKGVIPGWTEGLQLMTVGSKYRFVIPSDLAYGERGAGESIGPGETLVFDVELLEIKEE